MRCAVSKKNNFWEKLDYCLLKTYSKTKLKAFKLSTILHIAFFITQRAEHRFISKENLQILFKLQETYRLDDEILTCRVDIILDLSSLY